MNWFTLKLSNTAGCQPSLNCPMRLLIYLPLKQWKRLNTLTTRWPVSSSTATHSDPEESPSTVPALTLSATPFSCSASELLVGLARPLLEAEPGGDAVARWSLCTWLAGQLLSTMGDSCFFFRMPAGAEQVEQLEDEKRLFSLRLCNSGRHLCTDERRVSARWAASQSRHPATLAGPQRLLQLQPAGHHLSLPLHFP